MSQGVRRQSNAEIEQSFDSLLNTTKVTLVSDTVESFAQDTFVDSGFQISLPPGVYNLKYQLIVTTRISGSATNETVKAATILRDQSGNYLEESFAVSMTFIENNSLQMNMTHSVDVPELIVNEPTIFNVWKLKMEDSGGGTGNCAVRINSDVNLGGQNRGVSYIWAQKIRDVA